jgi:bla regulator protein BlaR1
MQLEADFYLIRLLSTIWAIGVLVSFSQWFKARQFWGAELRSAELVGEPEILNALADAEHDLGLEPQVTIVHSPHVSSPALYGLFKPRLVIPSSMMRILTQHQWYLIFRHEMAHVKRGDMVVMHLIALFQALHWFNPVIRHLLRMVMVDMELAADASALNGRKSSDRKLYARTLLRFVEQPEANIEKIHGRPLRVGFWEEEYEIFSRFRQLSGPVKSGLRGLIPGIALLLLLVVTGLTDPMFPRPVQPLSFDSIRVLVDW